MSALVVKGPVILILSNHGGAAWRTLTAALIGAGLGLGLGAAYLAAGLDVRAADHARASGIAAATLTGYSGAQPIELRATMFRLIAPAPSAAVEEGAAAARAHELNCLTQAVYYEARGEDARGQAAVAQVVMNRVRSPAFPKTVCAVVFEGAGHRGCQFSFACDGSMRAARETGAWERARRIAARTLSGVALAEVGSATHFHTLGVAPAWGAQMRRVAQVGEHVFYRFAPRRTLVAVETTDGMAARGRGPDLSVKTDAQAGDQLPDAAPETLPPTITPIAPSESPPAAKATEAAAVKPPGLAGEGAS